MIKFFRKIRQQLISENRFAKYIFYALGEIFLVVVGILIALQVNNWNENRKMQGLKGSYKLTLIEDLKKDTTVLNEAIQKTETGLSLLTEISDKISTQPLNLDSIINIYRFRFSPLFDASRDYNRNTMEGLLSTGHINLFDKAIYNSLMNLNSLQNKTIEIMGINLGFYMNISSRANLPFVDELNEFNGFALESVWANLNKDEFLFNFNQVLTSKMLAYKIILSNRKNLLEETKAVLKLLNEAK